MNQVVAAREQNDYSFEEKQSVRSREIMTDYRRAAQASTPNRHRARMLQAVNGEYFLSSGEFRRLKSDSSLFSGSQEVQQELEELSALHEFLVVQPLLEEKILRVPSAPSPIKSELPDIFSYWRTAVAGCGFIASAFSLSAMYSWDNGTAYVIPGTLALVGFISYGLVTFIADLRMNRTRQSKNQKSK